jgi:predicted nucleotidyltransferase
MSAILDNMYLTNPIEDLIPGPRGRLLATMAQLEAPVTIRALARHAGVAPQTALTVVNDMASAGIVSSEPAGKAQMIALNRSHLAAEPLLALAHARSRLVTRLRDELAAWDELAGAWLFGSAARGSGSRESDVDIMLVAQASIETKQWADSVSKLIAAVERWTGNQVQVVEYTASSFAHLIRQRNLLVDAIRHDGIALTPGTDDVLGRPR